MSRIWLCCLVFLAVSNCPVLAQYDSPFDVFAGGTLGAPLQAEPALRDFLRNRAVRLKQEWQAEGSPTLPIVFARFDEYKRSWQVECHHSNKTVEAEAAIKLVQTVLQDKPPSTAKPFAVVLVFNSYPDKAPPLPKAPVTSSPNTSADIDFGPYMAMLQKKIKSNWILKEAPEHNVKAVVQFAVKENGAVTDLQLTSTAGNVKYDKAALAAVTDSNHFLPLPQGSSAKVGVQFTFDYQPGKPTGDDIFTIELAQPEVVFARVADLSALGSRYGHFGRL
jgi:TonB family protein